MNSKITDSKANVNRPRAVMAGVIFGSVDCYVMEDGTTVLSQRGILRGLCGETGSDPGANVDRYLASALLSSRGPAIGEQTARLYILGPLKEVARIKAMAIKSETPLKLKSLRTIAENQLRDRMHFPRAGGQSWHIFPTPRLGEAGLELAKMLADARSLAGVAAAKPAQLVLLRSPPRDVIDPRKGG